MTKSGQNSAKNIIIATLHMLSFVSGSKIENFKVDFIDGTIFLRLMEVLSGKSVKRYHMFPQSITQRCDNVQLALDICARYARKCDSPSVLSSLVRFSLIFRTFTQG